MVISLSGCTKKAVQKPAPTPANQSIEDLKQVPGTLPEAENVSTTVVTPNQETDTKPSTKVKSADLDAMLKGLDGIGADDSDDSDELDKLEEDDGSSDIDNIEE